MSIQEGKAFLKLVVVVDENQQAQKPACSTVEPELFFPNFRSQEEGERTEELAKAVCQRCPITSQCLEFAFHTNDKWAILGGMTPAERESIRRRNTSPGLKVA